MSVIKKIPAFERDYNKSCEIIIKVVENNFYLKIY